MGGDPIQRDSKDENSLKTLEAEMRQAIQHRDAELQRASEAVKDLEGAIKRAREALDRLKKPGSR